MRELSLHDVKHVSAAAKDNLELYFYVNVPAQSGEFFGGLLPNVLDGTLSLEDFANAILASSEAVDGSKVKSIEITAWHSNW